MTRLPLEVTLRVGVMRTGVWADNTLPRASAPANETSESLAGIVNLLRGGRVTYHMPRDELTR